MIACLQSVRIFLLSSFLILPATALPVYPIDSSELYITSHRDPNFPIPRIGARGLSITFKPPLSWTQIAVKLRVSQDPEALENGTYSTVDASYSLSPNGFSSASTILPWERPKPSTLLDIPADIAPPGSDVFYRWEIRYTENGQQRTAIGDRHAFTMPRRVIIAILGDSFGSGEGAPSRNGDPWQLFNEGVAAHRSPISGQELAVKNFFATREDIAYDYLNVSSSGAIASDIYSTTSQFVRNGVGNPDPSSAEGIRFVQRTRLTEWLTARDYSSLDAIILSCGGNDVGFSTVLTNYLGLDREKLTRIAKDTLTDARCIVAAATTFFGLGGPINILAALPAANIYVACIVPKLALNVYAAIQEDTSFKDPYNAGTLSFNQYRPFSWYEARLRTEYSVLSRSLNYSLSNNGRQVKPDRVFVTEYPAPLKDATSFHETPPLVSLASDTPLLSIGLNNIPGLSFIKKPTSITFDLTKIRGLRVGFSTKETTEINTELAPQLTQPRPAYGGLNHLIREIVTDIATSTPDVNWTLVRTSDFQPPRTGVSYTGSHFNSLTTAQDQAGPNILNNAYHPNQLGHEFTYQPAIRAALEQHITPLRLEERAAEEGLTRPTDPLPDLAFEIGSPTISFTPGSGTGRLSADLRVVNRGNLSVAAGTRVAFELLARTNLKFPEETLPRLDINESHQIRLELEIPHAAIVENMPFDCNGAPFPGFDAFATRDAVLRYFFSADKGELRITIDPTRSIPESNKPNNIAKRFIDLPADDSAPGFRAAIQSVLADLSSLLGRPVATIDLALLIQEWQVRDYFRYYSPQLDLNNQTVQQALAENETYRQQVCIAQTLGIEPPPPRPNPVVMGDLRPICLFPPATGNCVTATETLVRDDLGRLSDLREAALNAPRDGRRIAIEAILNETFAAILGRPTLPTNVVLPVSNGGLKSPPEGLPLDPRGTRFTLQHLPGIETYSISLGTQPGTSDLLPATPLDPQNNSIDFADLPKDGRTVHATITTFSPSGAKRSFYQFPTQRLNAALTSPNPDQRLVTEGAQLRWDHPDATIAGPVTSYAVAVGSYPGTSDIFPGLDGAGLRRNSPDAIQFRLVPPTENSISLNNLPRDGRKLYVTLGTLRDGVWEYEIHPRFAAQTTRAGIRIPSPDRPILTREHFYLARGSDPTESLQLIIGSSPGADDLFASPEIPSADIDQPIDVFLREFIPRLDDEGRPFPVWATIIPDGNANQAESYGLIPSLDASFIEPYPDQRLKANTPITFSWSQGIEAEAYRITVHSGQNGDKPLYQETFDPSITQAEIPLQLTTDPAVVIVIETLRERNERFSTGANGSIYLIDQPDFRYYSDDRIDDRWQLNYFGPNNPNGLARADVDGDGRDNLAEFLAGSDPTRADAPLLPQIVPHPDSGLPAAFLIENPMSWTLYQVEQSTTLGGDWRSVSDPIAPSPVPGGLLLPIPASAEPTLFHRLRLIPRNP